MRGCFWLNKFPEWEMGSYMQQILEKESGWGGDENDGFARLGEMWQGCIAEHSVVLACCGRGTGVHIFT